MSRFGDKLQLLADGLATAYPARIVTRAYEDLSVREDAELAKGVYSIVSGNGSNFADERNRADSTADLAFLLIAQIKLTEKSTGQAVEEAELTMLDEVHDYLLGAPANLCGIDIESFAQSQQLETPYGWIAIKLTWSEF